MSRKKLLEIGIRKTDQKMTREELLNSVKQNLVNREKVDYRLKEIMIKIHHQCKKYGKGEFQENINYYKGANIAGFVKVADAMIAQGI